MNFIPISIFSLLFTNLTNAVKQVNSMRKHIRTILFVISISVTTVVYSQPFSNKELKDNGDVAKGESASTSMKDSFPIGGGLAVIFLTGVLCGGVSMFRNEELNNKSIL